MKLKYFRLLILFVPVSLASVANGITKTELKSQDSIPFVSPFAADNELCFKCHGQNKYVYTNENLGREVKALMFPERIIDRNRFYQANHRGFKCTDCHSEDYSKFPHPGELRMEQMYNCIDCHGGDEKFAKFKFEEIDSEYQKSVHYRMTDEGFTCWKCHNPHEYKISIRNTNHLKETILYDNNICLNCHANFDHFQLLTEREEISILQKHEWLPNQALHFKSVRCIECHSQNSILMSSLYKFRSKEMRKNGFLNGIILNESYVIGANRNKYLNIFSIIIFGIVLIIIGGHIFFRVIRKSKK
jgi:hypothetical protein